MNKPKAQTLQQKLGFFDEDLKKPKHDELMLWLDNNIERIINRIFNSPFTEDEIKIIREREWKKVKTIIGGYDRSIESFQRQLNYSESEKRDLPSSLRYSNEELEKYIFERERKKKILEQFDIDSNIPSKPRITKIKKTWELPVSTKNYSNKYTIGFIDFAASFNIPMIELLGLKYTQKDFSLKKDYYDVDESDLRYHYYPDEKTIFVEVKTEILSLGELLRQINHYKTYLNGDYYVLCPDNTYKDKLLEQGVNFIDYE